MELKELTEKTLELFETESADQLGQRLLEAVRAQTSSKRLAILWMVT